MSKLIKRIIAVLNLPSAISELILKSKTILKAMQSSAYFTALKAELEALEACITTAETSEIAWQTDPPTVTTSQRNSDMEALRNCLRGLRNMVQNIADADSANARTIILSAGMDTKKEGTYVRKQNMAENDTVEGTVILYGQGAGPHEWRISTDGVNWTNLTPTTGASTTVANLTPGTVYYFQNRKMLKNNEAGEWSNIYKIRVA